VAADEALESPAPGPDDAGSANGAGPVWLRLLPWAAFGAAVLAGAVLRFWDLSLKPLHHDEGVNGYFLYRLIEEGYYRYDPTNYHGPFLYYAGWLPLALGGAEANLRFVQAFAGSACPLLLLPLRRRHLGWSGVVAGSVLLAASPSLVFFSRTAIHEIYVVFFTLGAVAAFAAYADRRARWFPPDPQQAPAPWSRRTVLLALGLTSLGLVYANKETAVITYASLGCGGGLAWLLARGGGGPLERWRRLWTVVREEWRGRASDAPAEPGPPGGAATAAGLVLAAVAVAFFASVAARVTVWGAGSGNAWRAVAPFVDQDPTTSDPSTLTRVATGVIALGAVTGGAWLLVGLWRSSAGWWRGQPARRGWLAAAAVAFLVLAALFTSLFTWPRGLFDLFASLYYWVARGIAAEETGQEKPWPYYLKLLWLLELPVVYVALAGWVVAFVRRRPFDLFVVGWGASTLLVYTVLSYKTPWLILNPLLPLALAGAVAASAAAGLLARLARGAGAQPEAGVALAALAIPLLPASPPPDAAADAGLEYPSNFDHSDLGAWLPIFMWWRTAVDVAWDGCDDDAYPIVYTQAPRGLRGLIRRSRAYLEAGYAVQIVSPDYWPLPFYLNEWSLGYFVDDPPANLDAVVIAKLDRARDLGPRTEDWHATRYSLRPSVTLVLLVRPDAYARVEGAAEPP